MVHIKKKNLKKKKKEFFCVGVNAPGGKKNSKLVVLWCDVQLARRAFYKVTQTLDSIGQGGSQPILASPYNNFVKNN